MNQEEIVNEFLYLTSAMFGVLLLKNDEYKLLKPNVLLKMYQARASLYDIQREDQKETLLEATKRYAQNPEYFSKEFVYDKDKNYDTLADIAYSDISYLFESKILIDRMGYRKAFRIVLLFGELFKNVRNYPLLSKTNEMLKFFRFSNHATLSFLKTKYKLIESFDVSEYAKDEYFLHDYNGEELTSDLILRMCESRLPELDKVVRLKSITPTLFQKLNCGGPLTHYVNRIRKNEEPFDDEKLDLIFIHNIRHMGEWIRYTNDSHIKGILKVLFQFDEFYVNIKKPFMRKIIHYYIAVCVKYMKPDKKGKRKQVKHKQNKENNKKYKK